MSEEEQHVERDYVQPRPVAFLGQHELTLWSFYRALLVEFVAALLLLYVTTATAIGHKKLNNDDDMCGGVGLLGVAWANGGMIFLLVYCTAGVSGGYINPAVTFGLFVARKVSVIRMVMYTIAQCLGAVCGAAIVKAIMKSDYNNFGGGTDTVNDGYSTGVAVWSEILGTFVLVYTVLTATDAKRNARDAHVLVLAPLPIGFVVFMIHLATIPITGTGINPARSFGAAVMYNNEKAWDNLGLFWYGPMIGAFVAAIYHEYILRASNIKAFGSFESNLSN